MEITSHDVTDFLRQIESKRLDDILELIEIGKKLFNEEPKIWGSIIGFKKLFYKYKTNHEGYMPLFSFANRKNNITLYLSYDLSRYEELNNLGKFKIGKGCLYINKLSDVNKDQLIKLIKISTDDILKYPFIKEIKMT